MARVIYGFSHDRPHQEIFGITNNSPSWLDIVQEGHFSLLAEKWEKGRQRCMGSSK
jgi:hypothetical protein